MASKPIAKCTGADLPLWAVDSRDLHAQSLHSSRRNPSVRSGRDFLEANMMKLFVTLSIAATQLVAVMAFAQGNNTVDPSQGKARPTQETTSQERSTARAERKVEGAEAARGPQIAEGQTAPTARETPARADRKASNQKRREANSELNKEGALPRGGSNQ